MEGELSNCSGVKETVRIGNYDYLIHENANYTLVNKLRAVACGQVAREIPTLTPVENDEKNDDSLYGFLLFFLGFITLL